MMDLFLDACFQLHRAAFRLWQNTRKFLFLSCSDYLLITCLLLALMPNILITP